MGDAKVYLGLLCQVYYREFDRPEAKARRDRVGLWVLGENYQSLDVFRRRMRFRRE